MRAGIPSHDTIGRVFQLLEPEQFATAFCEFIAAITEKPI
ncbi:MAG: transposase family protein, partial [Deltaproteobacteria bacterium]|nr:transposase family protein [Deltaproteobacteria bacterium]